MSFMAKFLVQGRDAGKFLNRLSTNNVNDKYGTPFFLITIFDKFYLFFSFLTVQDVESSLTLNGLMKMERCKLMLLL